MSPYVKHSIEKNLEMVACPFCGSKEAEKYRHAADIVKCRSCGTVYLRTRLTREALDALYQSYAAEGSHMALPESREDILKNPLRREWFMEEILQYIDPKGKLLDIGCGWGAFLDLAREKGFDVMGIEITRKTADFAVKQLDLEVYNVPFSELDFQDDSFSAVTMIHTLEHLPNAKKNIEKTFRILREGGLFAGVVPNIESYASENLKDDWEWIDPYHHIIHFSPDILRKHLKNAGFTVENIHTAPGDFNKDVLRDLIKTKENISDDDLIDKRVDELAREGKGEEIRFYALKNSQGKNGTSRSYQAEKNNSSQENFTEDEHELVIELFEGDDYQEKLFNQFAKLEGPKRIIIKDNDNILPEFADNWNGVKVIRSKKAIEEDIYLQTDIENNESDIMEIEQPVAQTKEDSLEESTTGLKLNLGCGDDILEGYKNIDLYAEGEGIIRMDARELEYDDDSVDHILAKDLLQYIPQSGVKEVFEECARVLRPGGTLDIICPAIDLIAENYASEGWDIDTANEMIYGKQEHPGDYCYTGFDTEKIKTHLEDAGMQVVTINEEVVEENGEKKFSITATAKSPELRRETETENHAGVSGQMGFDFNSLDKAVDKFSKTNIEKKSKGQDMEQFTGFDFSGEKADTGKIETESDENIGDLSPELNIVWEGSQFVYHSLALINREHCSNIIDTNLADVHIIPYEKEHFEPEGNPKYEKLKSHDIRFKEEPPEEYKKLPYLWIRHQWPPNPEPPKGAKWVIMQPWEFSQLRQDFAEIFEKADEIWTPSNYSRFCMVNSGIHFSKVQVIPNGIDPEMVTPKGDKYPLKTDKKFKMLYVGGTIFRKGIDVLLKAYISAFSAEDDVSLIIKDMGGESFYSGLTAKDQIEEIQKDPEAPEIIYIDDYLTEEDIFKLYRSCDLFVSPYRGEGFSLPTLEAMGCGLPVVVTKGGATDDFCDEEVAWQIPSTKRYIGEELDGEPMTGDAYLLEPDIDSLTATLKHIYVNPGEAIKTGIKAQYRARTQWTWNNATLKVFARIDALYGKQLARKAETALVNKDDTFTLFGRAEKEYDEGNYEKAKELFSQVLGYNDLTEKYRIHALHRLAMIELELEDYDNADKYLEQAGMINPDHPDTRYIKSIMKEKQGDLVEALEIRSPLFEEWKDTKFRSSIGINLDVILNETAENFMEQGDLENALKLFTEALKMNNNNANACLGAARCFARANIKDEATKMYEWALKLEPTMEEARKELNDLK